MVYLDVDVLECKYKLNIVDDDGQMQDILLISVLNIGKLIGDKENCCLSQRFWFYETFIITKNSRRRFCSCFCLVRGSVLSLLFVLLKQHYRYKSHPLLNGLPLIRTDGFV